VTRRTTAAIICGVTQSLAIYAQDESGALAFPAQRTVQSSAATSTGNRMAACGCVRVTGRRADELGHQNPGNRGEGVGRSARRLPR
jgi:hypothetical protein